jgi:choline dehydrogenase
MLTMERADVNSESPEASWEFFVSHYQDETQARRDNKFTYRLNNGSYYTGLEPPEGAEP